MRAIEGRPGSWSYDGLVIQSDPDAHRAAVALAQARLRPGDRVLDVGAGSGALARQLEDAGFDVTCTTWNGRCQAGRAQYQLDLDDGFTLGDVGGVPFAMVTVVDVLEHVEHPAALLRACADVLAPDGVALVTTPNVGGVPARLQWLLRGCPDLFTPDEVARNRHISMIWPEGMQYLVAQAGLRVLECRALRGMRRLPPWRRGAYALAARALHATLGATLLYVLEHSPAGAQRLGPLEVY